MKGRKASFRTIDEYIAGFPAATQRKLREMRAVIRAAAPQAEEKISYQLPAFALKGNLVYFGAFTGHIGFYPAPRGIEAFKAELSKYEGAKGTVRFPLDKPLPARLIARIVRFRVAENLEKAAKKSRKKK
jgi:uncharacterized protein YdhG (YjbR/CyaY superfamily)